MLLESGNEDNAKGLLDQAILDFEQSVIIDSGDLRVVENLALAQQLQASLMLEESIDETLALSAQSQTRILELVDMGASKPRTVINAAVVALTRGQILFASGDESGADSTWQAALELLDLSANSGLLQFAIERQLQVSLNNESASTLLDARLAEAGFNDPRYF